MSLLVTKQLICLKKLLWWIAQFSEMAKKWPKLCLPLGKSFLLLSKASMLLSCNIRGGLQAPVSDRNPPWYLSPSLYFQMQGLSQRSPQEDVSCMVSQSPDDIQSIPSKFLAKALVIVDLYLQPEYVKDDLLDVRNIPVSYFMYKAVGMI